MTSPIGLTEMPEVVLNKIMKESNLKSILILRKVCHSLRTFINTHESGLNLIDLNIYIKSNEIEAWYYSRNGLNVNYQATNQEKSCSVVHENKIKVLRDLDFVDAFLLDLEIFISHQNTVLRQFRVTPAKSDPFQTVKDVNLPVFNRILEALANNLENRHRPLQTNEIHLGVENQEQVVSILKYIDAKVLKNLSIYSNLKEEEEKLKIDELMRLDHWKQAESLMIEDFYLDVNVECLTHFSFVRVVLKTISTNDLTNLKENVFHSSKSKEFSLTYIQTGNQSEMSSVLGEPVITTDIFGRQDYKWSIDSPVNGKKVEIIHYKNNPQFKITNIESLEDRVKRMTQERS